MPLLFVCQSVSKRNSSSSRGVVVARGVAQCGCSACVLSTRLNQFAKYPGLVPPLGFVTCEGEATAASSEPARMTKALRQNRTLSPFFPESNTLDRGAPQDSIYAAKHFNAVQTDRSNRINTDYFTCKGLENRLFW